MKLREVQSILEAEVFFGEDKLDIDVEYGCGSDLMSDVLAFAHQDKGLLLTGLSNHHVIQTAIMIDAVAVVFVRGKKPDKGMLDAAKKMGLPLLGTKYYMYDSCGRLYKAGLRGTGCSIEVEDGLNDHEKDSCVASEPV